VLFDEHFTTVGTTMKEDQESYLEKLFHTITRLLHRDKFSGNPHLFESFWDNSSLVPHMQKRKKSTPNTEANLRGSSDITEQHGLELILSAPAETSTAPDTLVITTEENTLHTASIPNDPILDPPNGQGPTTSMEIPTETPYKVPHELPRANTRPQYDRFDNSDYDKSYKRQRGIDGAIHILVATNDLQTGIPTSDFKIAPTQANIFSAFVDLPTEHVDPCLHAFPIVDNKANTFMQSHM
jgi:hypothetical protein